MGSNAKTVTQLQPRRLREWVPGFSLLQTSKLQLLLLLQPPKLHEDQLSRWPCPRSSELPRGLRGVDQQADQHGILCLVRLSFHEFLVQPGRPSPPRIR